MIQVVLQGLEYGWLAVDSLGHVGWICTAGGGLTATDIVERVDQHLAAIKTIRSLAPTTLAAEGPGEDEFRIAATRGLFVFDSSYTSDPYARVATPIAAALIDDLPETFAIARRIQIRGDFRELSTIPSHLIDEHG